MTIAEKIRPQRKEDEACLGGVMGKLWEAAMVGGNVVCKMIRSSPALKLLYNKDVCRLFRRKYDPKFKPYGLSNSPHIFITFGAKYSSHGKNV